MKKFADTICGKKTLAAAKGILSDSDVHSLFDQIDANQASGKIEDVIRGLTKKKLAEDKLSAFMKQRTALFNTVRKTELVNFAGKWEKPLEAIKARIVGKSDRGVGARDSAAAYRHSFRMGEEGQLREALRTAKVLPLFESGDFDIYIARAKEKLSLPPEKWAARPYANEAIPKEAAQIAKILEDQQARVRSVENSMGAYVAKRPGFVASQSHDRSKIANASGRRILGERRGNADKLAYASDLLKWLDMDGTAANLAKMGRLDSGKPLEPQKFAEGLWEIFTTGIRKSENGGSGHAAGNAADQLEMGRVIEFKDADSWLAYNQKYGAGSLATSVSKQIETQAHGIATLKYFGPSAEKNIKDVTSYFVTKEARTNKNYKANPALESKMIDKYWQGYNGELSVSLGPTVDGLVNTTMALNRFRQLGSAPIASFFSDPITTMAKLKMNGLPLARAIISPIETAIKRMGKSELNSYLRGVGIGNETELGMAASRFDGEALQMSDWLNTAQSFFFKWTGLSPLTDGQKSGYVARMSNFLAEESGKGFDKLDHGTQLLLGDYEIKPQEWDLIRSHAIGKFDEWKVLDVQAVRNLEDDAISALLKGEGKNPTKRAVNERRFDLENRLRTMFLDSADDAVITPDARTGAVMHIDNPYLNLGARLALQYKSFPAAFTQRMLIPLAKTYGAKSAPVGIAAVGMLVAGLTAGGMMQEAARRFLSNQWFPDDMQEGDWAQLLAAGFQRGGGLGVFTDLIYNTDYESGRTPAASLSGPTLDVLFKPMVLGYKKLAGKDVGQETVNYARSLIPGNNVWYLKPLLDYSFYFGISELVNPGAVKRMEERAQEKGRPYIIPPSEAALGGK